MTINYTPVDKDELYAPPENPLIKEFREFIEKEVLKIIKTLAQDGKVGQDRIQAIAKNTLQLVKKGMSLEELYAGAVKLDDNYSELAPVVLQVMRQYEEKYEKKALIQVSQLIKAKQFDDAQNMVKKVLAYKIN